MAAASDTIEVLNVGHPGKTYRVNGEKFNAMKKAVLAVLPNSEPGMNVPDAIEATKAQLPEDLFPGGETAGWWFKSVQLDLEARGTLKRAAKPPVRLWKTTGKA